MTRSTRAWLAVIVLVVSGTLRASPSPPIDTRQPPATAVSSISDQAFRAAYNLDHDEALMHARRAVALAPNESEAHRTLAPVLWRHRLHRRRPVVGDSLLAQ